MKKGTFLLLLISLFSPGLFYAQNNPDNYQLLWKITGNDLPAPSYLFGTVHLEDEEVFNFPDSLLPALMSCEVLANELDTDSLYLAVMMDVKGGLTEERIDLKDSLKAETYAELSEIFFRKNGVELEELRFSRPDQLEYFLGIKPPKLEGPKRETFLDAWLSKQARLNGLKIIGLEYVAESQEFDDPDDWQTEVEYLLYLLENPDARKESFLHLLDIYKKGRLDEFEKQVNRMKVMNPEDYGLNKQRNLNMATRAMPIIRRQPTFIAVGTMHLPGEDGLISLFRKAGYTVEPVPATFTGMAAQYQEPETQLPWFDYVAPFSYYTVSFPHIPYQLVLDSTNGKGVWSCKDMNSGSEYSLVVVEPFKILTLSELKEKLKKNTDLLTGNLPEGTKVKKIREQTGPGGESLELYVINPKTGSEMRYRIFLNGRLMYLLSVGDDHEHASSRDADRFFDSFRMQELPEKETWERFVENDFAFSIEMPTGYGPLDLGDMAEGTGVRLVLYSGVDHESGSFCAVRASKYAEGSFMDNDEELLHDQVNTMVAEGNMRLVDLEEVEIDGCRGLKFHSVHNEKNLGMDGLILSRTNILYLAFATFEGQETNSAVKDFMASLQILPFQKPEWRRVHPEGSMATVLFPKDTWYSEIDETDGDYLFYACQDTFSGASYNFEQYKYGDWECYANEDSLRLSWERWAETVGDTVLDMDIQTGPGVPAMDLVVGLDSAGGKMRFRLEVHGQYLFKLITVVPEEQLKSPDVERFFQSLEPVDSMPDWVLLEDKKERFFQDAAAIEDSLLFAFTEALETIEFTTADLPMIYKALETPRPGDTVTFFSFRQGLVDVLEGLSDSTTAPFLADLYRNGEFPDNADMAILYWMALDSNTRENRNRLFDLMHERPSENFSEMDGFLMSMMTTDSTELNADWFPRMHDFNKLDAWEYYRLMMFGLLLEDGVIDSLEGPKYRDEIIRHYFEAENRMMSSEDEESYSLYQSICMTSLNILPFLGMTPEADAMLSHGLSSPDTLLKKEAIASTLYLGRDLDPEVFEIFWESQKLRIELFRLLDKYGRLDLLPKESRNQEFFARMDLLTMAESYDDIPDKIEFLDAEKMNIDGIKGRLYFYRLWWDNDPGWYVGVSGFQPKKKSKYVDSGIFTFWYLELEATNDLPGHKTAAEKRIRELLEDFKQEEGGK